METKKYEVVVWKRDSKGELSCNTKWRGTDLLQGEVVAATYLWERALKRGIKKTTK